MSVARIEGLQNSLNDLLVEIQLNSDNIQSIVETQDSIKKQFNNYYTIEQANSAIKQKAESITSEVNKSISTAKQEAIDSANSTTDTKLEEYTTTVQSLIDQKSDTILASVSADYATKTSLDNVNKTLTASLELKVDTKKLISEINASADVINLKAGRLIITSGNFKLDSNGNITATGGTIGGFTLSQNTFTSNLTFNKTYSSSELDRLDKIVVGLINPTANDYERYDLDKSGSINSLDSLIIRRIINGLETGKGKLIFNTNKSEDAITIIDDKGKPSVNIGYFGSYIKSLQTENMKAGGLEAKTLSIIQGNTNLAFIGVNSSSSGDSPVLHLSNFDNVPTITMYGQNGKIEAKEIEVTNSITAAQVKIADGGAVMYAKDGANKYRCHWLNGQLQFWVDETNVGTLSDKRLKTDIKDIDNKFIQAIEEIEMKQFKVANRNGLISFGILAQDLIEIFEKYNISPFDYEIVYKTEYRTDDNTIYYAINYEQFLLLKSKAQELKIENLIHRIEKLEGVK